MENLSFFNCAKLHMQAGVCFWCPWPLNAVAMPMVRAPQQRLEMGEDEIIRFLSALAVHEQVSASTQNQALCALLFLYRYVLDRDVG